MNILAHCSFIGETGYAYHTREFLTRLSDYHNVKIRNYTVGNDWRGYSSPNCFSHYKYLTNKHNKLLHLQTLIDSDKNHRDYELVGYDANFIPDVNLVFAEVNHRYFYQHYSGYNIAYTVWESTKYPDDFIKILHTYDEVWVPTEWQRQISIDQGLSSDKVIVVPEGVDYTTFYPINVKPKKRPFRFIVMGRWDYRKATKEVIQAWTEEFSEDENVELLINVDNPFSIDGMNSTEERLQNYGISHKGIKVSHFLNRSEYVRLIKEGDVFLSCARSEGWNLPLIEAMASGTPSIYSDCSGQLEFASGKGIPVKIKEMKPAGYDTRSWSSKDVVTSGEYYEPDFEDLKLSMRYAYSNYDTVKKKALEDSKDIRETFTWENAASVASVRLNEITLSHAKNINATVNFMSLRDKITINFVNGAFVEVVRNSADDSAYRVECIDTDTNTLIHSANISANMWTRTSRSYFVNWLVKVYRNKQLIHSHKLNLKGKRVLIKFDSSSIGDTIAWISYLSEFRKKHDCDLFVFTHHNKLFESEYPDLTFIERGTDIDDLYATYSIGWYEDDNKNPINPVTEPLQKTATDILGLEFKEIVPKITKSTKPFKGKKYVTIAIQSTAQAKYWNNPTGWNSVVDYLNLQGYNVIVIDKYKTFGNGSDFINTAPNKCIDKTGCSLEEAIYLIQNSSFHIGISSGLSWVAFALQKPVVMISGFTDPMFEFKTNNYRLHDSSVCNSCFNNPKFTFDKGDWKWCPEHKNTDRMFECTKAISTDSVIDKINEVIRNAKSRSL